MNKKRFMLAILLIFVVCLSSSTVFAEDASNMQDDNNLAVENDDAISSSQHTISPGATSDEIQETINGMSDGDVLNFETGTYSDICIYVNKNITINGNGATLIGYDTPSKNNTPSIITNTTAQGGYGISNLATLYIIKASNVTVNGLNIVGGANSADTYSNALVFVTYSNELTFINNTLDGSSWGLYLQYSHDCVIMNNTIQNQAVTGILNFGSARTQIERNKIINAKNHGIDVRHGTGPNVQVINNTVIASKEGIYLMHSKGHTAAYNNIINCSISSISCYGSSNIILENNTLYKSRIGILLGGGYANINVKTNTFNLDNLPFPPTFVYYIAEGQSDYQSADNIMGTHSDSSSYTPTYVAYTGIPTPKNINIDYLTLLSETGTTYVVPAGATSSDIQAIIDSMNDGDTLTFEENAVYNNISIYTDKNIKIFGNNATLIGYDNIALSNVPDKITNTTANNGYGISERAVLYSINNTGVVISNLNIIALYPGYNTNYVVGNTNEYKTAGIRTQNSKNITITGCSIDGASWGIYLEYSGIAIVTNNEISNQYTTGILNFGTPDGVISGNTITNVGNHGIDVRHGTGPRVTVCNNTINGAKEGIYLMHSQGHYVYGNNISGCSISGITAYGSGNEYIYENSISGSRIGIILGGNYYNVTIGKNSYKLDNLPFPPTFVTYLAKAEQKYYQNAINKTYSNTYDTVITAEPIKTTSKYVTFVLTLTTAKGTALVNQTVSVTINDETYNLTTNANGVASVNAILDYGEYPVSMSYAGAGEYIKTIGTSSITVAKDMAISQISIIEASDDGSIVGLLKDSEGNAIANAVIAYTLNNVNATVTTDSKGQFTISDINGKVSMSYAGNDKISAANAEITLTKVTPEPVESILTVSALSVYAGDNGNLKVTLKDANDNLLAGKAVEIFIDGVSAGKVNTDTNGVATLAVKYASAGTHTVIAYFAGDDDAKSSIATGKITVNKKTTTLTASKTTLKVNKAKSVKVTLKANGKALANKKVTIKVNGKTFSGKTNSKGVATISVKVAKTGKFTALVKFAGDNANKASSKKVQYTVTK